MSLRQLPALCLWLLCASGCSRSPDGRSEGLAPVRTASSASAPAAPLRADPPPDAAAEPQPEAGAQRAHAGPCPQEMVHLGASCIDRYEAHLVVAGDDGRDRPLPHYERPARGVAWRAESAPGVFPQAYINRLESEQACANAGKRLCTLAEWYAACQGPRGLSYPYGNQLIAGRCNSGKGHLLSKLFGTNPRAWSYEKHFNDPKLNQQPGFLARTGEYQGCVSAHGVFDLVGNLHEWVSDRVDSSLPHKLPLQEDILKKVGPRTGNAIFMGGFFSTTSEHGKGCRFVTIGHEARYHDYSTGFRCCVSATGPHG